jgi:hypothetical protein
MYADSLANKVIDDALRDLLMAEALVKDPSSVEDERAGATLMAGLSGIIANAGNAISSSPGMALGIYVDKRITDNISFRPGIAIAVQSVDVNINTNTNTNDSYANINYVAPQYMGWNVLVEPNGANLNMIVMEVPLNFVFALWKGDKSKLFLTAGASTMIYLSQHFEGSFLNSYSREEFNSTTGNLNTVSNYSTTSVENVYMPFSHTDYLGLANISAGYSVPLGNTNSLLIEPFIQLPLASLTSINVKIRYGGLSMKLTFGRN